MFLLISLVIVILLLSSMKGWDNNIYGVIRDWDWRFAVTKRPGKQWSEMYYINCNQQTEMYHMKCNKQTEIYCMHWFIAYKNLYGLIYPIQYNVINLILLFLACS